MTEQYMLFPHLKNYISITSQVIRHDDVIRLSKKLTCVQLVEGTGVTFSLFTDLDNAMIVNFNRIQNGPWSAEQLVRVWTEIRTGPTAHDTE